MQVAEHGRCSGRRGQDTFKALLRYPSVRYQIPKTLTLAHVMSVRLIRGYTLPSHIEYAGRIDSSMLPVIGGDSSQKVFLL